MHYSDQQLLELLEDQPLAGLETDQVAHLETCVSCQQRLSKLSGDGDWLAELRDCVGDETRDEVHSAVSPASLFIAVDSSDGPYSQSDGEPRCDALRLDFLDPPSHPELLGRLGRYDIERLIGMGGFGVVFKARDSELNRIVAIKVLAPHLVGSGSARQRFSREAQASAAVVHDHVVPIYDVVSEPNGSYFVMKYIPGHSLQERVDAEGPLPMEEVLRIAAQMASGLHAAHSQGIIHRDVKPGNVLLEDSVDRVLISDFGLARATDDANLTRSGVITGTPHYMSPEQARGAAIDARSDLFSLGSVIYFMCTGRSPFRAPQIMAVLNRICHEDYRPLEQVNSKVPLRLVKIVNRLLRKSPDARYADGATVQAELNQLLSDYQSGKIRERREPTRFSRTTKYIAAAVLVSSLAIVGFQLRRNWVADDNDGGDRVAEVVLAGAAPQGPNGWVTVSEQAVCDESDSADCPETDVEQVITVHGDPSSQAQMAVWADHEESYVTQLRSTSGEVEQFFDDVLCPPDPAADVWDTAVNTIECELDRLQEELSTKSITRLFGE